MRTIKFRGKRVDNGEWVHGCFIEPNAIYSKDCASSSLDVNGDKHSIGLDVYLIDPLTVGQFTGLSDKNGNEIFEGDVVNYASLTCVVVYGERGSSFGLKSKGNLLDITVIDFQIANMYLKIIGNIHDNPDLIWR